MIFSVNKVALVSSTQEIKKQISINSTSAFYKMYEVHALFMIVRCFVLISSVLAFYKNMTLQQLDNKLVDMLTNPKQGEGDELMKASLYYFNQLEDMNVQCIREDPRKTVFTWMQTSLVKGIDKIKDYVKFGEPKFVNLTVKKRVLRDNYNWGDNEFIKFETYTLGIKILWNKFLEYIKEDDNKYF